MLQTIWNYLNSHYNQWDILKCTIFIVLISELPIIIFTLLDYYKFNCLKTYRIAYQNNPVRQYPTTTEIIQALQLFIPIVFIFLLPMTYFGMSFFEYINWNPYQMSIELPSYSSGFIQYLTISILSEFLFYGLHRLVHLPKLYWIHKHHHCYKYNSFSIVNHYLHPIEIILFIIPPALPPILCQSHLMIVWVYAIITNWVGAYIHSGYEFPLLETILCIKSRDHDIHHIRPKKNFSTGLFYSLVDRLFGTYLHLSSNS